MRCAYYSSYEVFRKSRLQHACPWLRRTAPVVYGQGFASGPVDEAVSQTVSESVEKAQEQQHLDDLAASTRAQQEAVQELSSSNSSNAAIYNNGGSRPAGQQEMAAAGLSSSRVQQEAVQEPTSSGSGNAAGASNASEGSIVQPHAATPVMSLHLKSRAVASADRHGSADEAELEAEPSDAIAGGQPPGGGLQQPMAGTSGRAHEGQPSQAACPMPANAPSHQALGGRSLQQARKAGSLQGARLPRAEKPDSRHSTL